MDKQACNIERIYNLQLESDHPNFIVSLSNTILYPIMKFSA